MPQITSLSYDPNDKMINELAADERHERCEMIDHYWMYYEGHHPRPLKVSEGQPDDNIILNLCGKVVDKTAEFLLKDMPEITIPDVDSDSETQQTLLAWLDFNDFEEFLADMAQSGFIAGHTFARLYMDGDEVRFALLDPRHVVAFWLRGMVKKAAWYSLQWDDRRQDIVPNNMVEMEGDGWQIIEYRLKETNGESKWVEDSRDDWPYPFAPIVDWKNKRAAFKYYGDSDLKHCHLNNTVNFLASNTSRIIKFHAHPKTIIAGGTLPEETRVDGIYEIDEDAEVYNLELKGDLSSSMQMLDKIEAAFYSQARVVDLSNIKDKLGQITNFGVRMMFSDMLAHLQQKQSLYGKGLAELIRRGMAVMGIEIALPVIGWVDPLPENRKELVDTAQVEKNIGTASTQTLAEDLGRDWAVEEPRIQEEQASALAVAFNG